MDADVIVAGGGASGLFAAVLCVKENLKVIVLEQKERIGKKILATGNGKCNFTNRNLRKGCYRGENQDFPEIALSTFGPEEAISYWEGLGIYPKDKNGYLYPYSEQAISVLDVLRMELEREKVPVACQEKVLNIEKKEKGFCVKTDKNTYSAKYVIVATGGKASPKLGSDGSGYKLARELGHSIIKPVPALIGLRCKEDYYKSVSGVRTEAEVAVYIDEKKRCVAKDKGELQLTNYGISGIPVFQISRFAAKALEERKKVWVRIDYMPSICSKELNNLLKIRFQDKQKTAEEALVGLFNKKLIQMFLKQSRIKSNMVACKITEQQIVQLTSMIKEMFTEVLDTNGFEQAQVTAGGVSTWEIASDTMESILVSGLYFTGEIMDVDGICGGYNLQWCWSSAFLAVKSIAKTCRFAGDIYKMTEYT